MSDEASSGASASSSVGTSVSASEGASVSASEGASAGASNPQVGEIIKLRVVGVRGHNLPEFVFRIRTSTELNVLKKSYAERVGLPLTALLFKYVRFPLNDRNCDHCHLNPAHLHMEDMDVIKVSKVKAKLPSEE